MPFSHVEQAVHEQLAAHNGIMFKYILARFKSFIYLLLFTGHEKMHLPSYKTFSSHPGEHFRIKSLHPGIIYQACINHDCQATTLTTPPRITHPQLHPPWTPVSSTRSLRYQTCAQFVTRLPRQLTREQAHLSSNTSTPEW